MIGDYNKAYTILNDKYEEVKKKRDQTFVMLKDKVEAEDLMFRTAELKNIAVDFHKTTLDLGVDVKVDIEYYEAKVKLGEADDLLKNLGYLKITESIRSTAVESLDQTREFRRVLGKIKSLAIGYQNLLESLKMDEVDFRQGAKFKMAMNGQF